MTLEVLASPKFQRLPLYDRLRYVAHDIRRGGMQTAPLVALLEEAATEAEMMELGQVVAYRPTPPGTAPADAAAK